MLTESHAHRFCKDRFSWILAIGWLIDIVQTMAKRADDKRFILALPLSFFLIFFDEIEEGQPDDRGDNDSANDCHHSYTS